MAKVGYKSSNNIARITLNNTKKLNAIDSEMIGQISMYLDKAVEEKNRVIILDAAGDHFGAGADIRELVKEGTGGTYEYEGFTNLSFDEAYEHTKQGADLVYKIITLNIPVIAEVRGFTLGGALEIASACDILVADEKSTKFGYPEAPIAGVKSGWNGLSTTSKKIGPVRTSHLAMTGEFGNAEQGKAWGLFYEIYGDKHLPYASDEIAEKIAMSAPIAIRDTKQEINRATYGDLGKLYDELIEGAEETAEHLSKTYDALYGAVEFLKGNRKAETREFKGK